MKPSCRTLVMKTQSNFSVVVEQAVLTPRELDVLQLIARGCSYSRVGDRLGVSQNTVATHIKNAYRKLEVHCAAAAVMRAMELGLVTTLADKAISEQP